MSTDEQRLDMQMQALKHAGCDRIFTDQGQTGARFERIGLETALGSLEAGDTLVVWRLDRLGRSLFNLVGLMEELGRRSIEFRSITENIDTSSSGGRLMFHMMAALAEFERTLISERTRAGMAAAKAGGKTMGRPKALTDDQVREAQHAIDCLKASRSCVAERFNVSSRTIDRHLRHLKKRPCNCGETVRSQPS